MCYTVCTDAENQSKSNYPKRSKTLINNNFTILSTNEYRAVADCENLRISLERYDQDQGWIEQAYPFYEYHENNEKLCKFNEVLNIAVCLKEPIIASWENKTFKMISSGERVLILRNVNDLIGGNSWVPANRTEISDIILFILGCRLAGFQPILIYLKEPLDSNESESD